MPTPFLCQTTDPWENFDQQNFDSRHNHPIVPEPRFYGAVLMGLVMAIYMFSIIKRSFHERPKKA